MREIEDFRVEHFDQLRGRVRDSYWDRNRPVMDRCEGLTILEDGRVLGCWGFVLGEPWVAVPEDLSIGDLRFVLSQMREWGDANDWVEGPSLQEEDHQARRFAEFMGCGNPSGFGSGVLKYERVQR